MKQFTRRLTSTPVMFGHDSSAKNATDDKGMHGDITPRKIPIQNVVYRLHQREVNLTRPGTQYHAARRFHTNVFPNFTVISVEKPPCFLRKFSPTGRYFIAFSSDQTSLEIYEFQGSASAEDLLHNARGECAGNDRVSQKIQNELFNRFFKRKCVTSVASGGEHLNRECSLFTDDGKYVIVGAATYHHDAQNDDQHPSFWDIYRNNESVTPNPASPLEDYSLHLVNLESGQMCDTRTFKCDKVFLSHNQGIYLYRNTLSVLSVQHQTIHVFQVTPAGSFVDVRDIGRFCYEDDELLFSASVPANRSRSRHGNPTRPFSEKTINSLKQRLLTFLYRRAESQGTPFAMRRFYQYFDQFLKLRMWKMQLLDESHLLIKYASEDIVTFKIADPNSQPSFFVIYNMDSTQVIGVYENSSEELLRLFENYCDMIRNAALHCTAQFTCSASSNVYAQQIQQRFKQTIINAKFGGHTEAVKRLLAQLPISSQSYSSSPYLDMSLFSYDDKWVSAMERPKACGDHPIRFYARDSGLLKFKIYAGVLGRNHPLTARRLVAFTFHPLEPFAISVQRTNSEYVVNFHIRHCPA